MWENKCYNKDNLSCSKHGQSIGPDRSWMSEGTRRSCECIRPVGLKEKMRKMKTGGLYVSINSKCSRRKKSQGNGLFKQQGNGQL